MANLNNPVWKHHKWSLPVNKTVLTVILALLAGSFLTHQVDGYISNHEFVYQSPIVIKSPVIVTEKLVSPVILTQTVMIPVASPSATPVTEVPKGLNLR